MFTVVVNCCLKIIAVFYDALHGFREGWGTRTATLEANLEQQLARLAHETFSHFFMYVRKAHELLDRGRCLKILRVCGMCMDLK